MSAPPVDPVTPPAVLLAWCDPEAPRIYLESVGTRPDAAAVDVELTLRQRGAWSYAAGGRLIKTGCLLRTQHADFLRALAAASFAPPPSPHATCDAVSTAFTRYFDLRGQTRSALSSTPCGSRASKDVHQLSALLHSYVGPTPSAPPPGRSDQRCLALHTWGPVIYLEQTRALRTTPLNLDRPSIAPRPRGLRGLTIYANGAWSSTGYGKQKQGCLDEPTRVRIGQLIRAAQFGTDPRPRARCRAMPRHTTTISTPSKSFTFRHPCGPALHPTLAALRNFVARSIRR